MLGSDVSDPEWGEPEEPPNLMLMIEDARVSYERARAYQESNPPDSVPTDMTLNQFLSIHEKGVSAWEFEPDFSTNLFVEGRTEVQFYDGECCTQTNLPLPKAQEVYYWEAKLFEKPANTIIAIGVATKPYPHWRLPGWNKHSIGYFSDTGNKFFNQTFGGRAYGQPFFEGDVIGVGYRHRTGTVFFTRNGRKLDDAYTGLRFNLFPTVGANGPCSIHVNFGQSGFVFIEANVKKWGLAPIQGTLAPPPAYGSDAGTTLLATGTPRPSEERPRPEHISRRAARNSFSINPPAETPSDARADISLADIRHQLAGVPPPAYSSPSSERSSLLGDDRDEVNSFRDGEREQLTERFTIERGSSPRSGGRH